jgi:hypothetical protein
VLVTQVVVVVVVVVVLHRQGHEQCPPCSICEDDDWQCEGLSLLGHLCLLLELPLLLSLVFLLRG